MKQNITTSTIKQFTKNGFFDQHKVSGDKGYMSQDGKHAWFLVEMSGHTRLGTIEFESGRAGFSAHCTRYESPVHAMMMAKKVCESYNRRKIEEATLEQLGA